MSGRVIVVGSVNIDEVVAVTRLPATCPSLKIMKVGMPRMP